MINFRMRTEKIIRLNSSREYLAEFAQQAANSMLPGGRVLDAGAGECPYRDFFSHAHYHAADIYKLERQYGPISFVCDLARIPARKDYYDLVFCSQTLEHVPEPNQVLREIHRVLKPGGYLWLSAPLFFAEHEIPFDYYRYTQYGFTYLLESVGFEVVSINWLEGYFGTLAYQLRFAAKAIPLQPAAYGNRILGLLAAIFFLPIKISFVLLSILLNLLDTKIKLTLNGMCKNYAVVARKHSANK